MKKNKIFSHIQEDIGKIERQLSNRNASRELWDNLQTKYSIMLPDITKHVRAGGKMAAMGQEFDYRPELKKLKTALLTWISINEDELEIEGEYINNEAKYLISKKMFHSSEEEINNLVIESKIYISKKEYREKFIGVEKLWDAFERLKTTNSTNKKKSIENIISCITNDDEGIKEMITKEFNELTKIGNSYSIRHHEMNQKQLPNTYYVEYLYFRLLSLISCVINLMESGTGAGTGKKI